MKKLLIAAAVAVSSIAVAQDAGVAPAAAPAAPPPPADEVRRVLDYYYNGKDRGPTLLELKACLKVDTAKDSTTKFECLEPVTGPVKVGTSVHAWVSTFVPKGGSYDNVVLQFLFEGEPRTTIDLKLDSEMRSRTWRTQQLTKKGKWTIRVAQAGKELGLTTVTAE